ncbi:hypothetical protein ScPMuIL_003768 [Solemya velum]
MGTRLRTLVNKMKGVKLSDGKTLQGKGRLTQKRIDSFQVFYGVALRSNKCDLNEMCRSTKAILTHYSDTPDDYRHENCPDGSRRRWVAMDQRRIYEVSRQAGDGAKDRRRKHRQIKMKQLDVFEKDDGQAYRSGAFHAPTEKAVRCCRKCGKPIKGHPRSRCIV